MSIISTGQDINIYLETREGQVFSGRCIAAEISHSVDTREMVSLTSYRKYASLPPARWEINLEGMGNLTFTHGSNMATNIVSKFLPQEWGCYYCGRANSLKKQQCGSCGWYRGVIVDVAQEAGVWRVRR